MNLCITGGAGFIGSYFLEKALEACAPEDQIVVYDALTYAGDLSRIKKYDADRFVFIQGDINDRPHFERVLAAYEITHIVHFAAETHVDRSIEGDSLFLKTNVCGTWSVVTAAADFWLASGGYSGRCFLHISTDEVYGVTALPADEKSVLMPSNPYAASKAAADQYVLMRRRFDGFPARVVRSTNNFGIGQHPEKLIPKIIAHLESDRAIPIYGDGRQRRCWLYAGDYAVILWKLLKVETSEFIFNVRGKSEIENLELAVRMRTAYAAASGKALDCVSPIVSVEDRKGHDSFYNINDDRLHQLIGPFSYLSLDDFIKTCF